MAVAGVVLLVFFVIVSVLLVLMVLVQTEEGSGLGGIFGGGSGSAFGSRSGNVLTRTTTVLGTLFLIISLGLALINRAPRTGVEAEAMEIFGDIPTPGWVEEVLNPPEPIELDGFTFDLDTLNEAVPE